MQEGWVGVGHKEQEIQEGWGEAVQAFLTQT